MEQHSKGTLNNGMISDDERNKPRRNIRKSQFGQMSKGIGDFFHDPNRDETFRPEVKRFEIFEVGDGDNVTVAKIERQLFQVPSFAYHNLESML